MPSKFSELSVQLDKALDDVGKKKKVLEDAQAALNKAGLEYSEASSAARSLRGLIESSLNDALGQDLKPKIG